MKDLTEINDINTEAIEGKLLLAAIARITSRYETSKTPMDILKELNKLKDQTI